MTAKPGAADRWRSLVLGLLVATVAVSAWPAEPASLRFDQVFTADGEPSAQHFSARFVSRGEQHVMQLWRDGDRRLVRRTDDATEIHVSRTPHDPDYEMVVLDLRRKLETRVARYDLYRLGSFTDWFDLAHGLRHPKAAYRLTATSPPKTAPLPIQACRWYRLEQSGRSTRICWSAREHVPMLMLGDDDRVAWALTELTHKPAPASVFEIHDIGFVRNDAHRDITGD